MVSESETVEMEVHQLLKGDVDTGLVCLSGADLDELVEANRALEAANQTLRAQEALLDDALMSAIELHCGNRSEAAIDQYAKALKALTDSGWKSTARQRLATEHGLPLPEVER